VELVQLLRKKSPSYIMRMRQLPKKNLSSYELSGVGKQIERSSKGSKGIE